MKFIQQFEAELSDKIRSICIDADEIVSWASECALEIYHHGVAAGRKNTYILPYDELRFHVGHKIEINTVQDWHTNREYLIEIYCLDERCKGSERLMEMDSPHTSK
jgi:hypothetical protein